MHVYGISTGYLINDYFHYVVLYYMWGLDVFLDINL